MFCFFRTSRSNIVFDRGNVRICVGYRCTATSTTGAASSSLVKSRKTGADITTIIDATELSTCSTYTIVIDVFDAII